MGICIRVYVADNARELNVVVSNDDSKRNKSKEDPSKVVADFTVPLFAIAKSEQIATICDEIDCEDVKIENISEENEENVPAPSTDDNFIDVNDVDDNDDGNDAHCSNEEENVGQNPSSDSSNQVSNKNQGISESVMKSAPVSVTEFLLPDMSRQLAEQLKIVNRNTNFSTNRQVMSKSKKHDVCRYSMYSNTKSHSYETSRQNSNSGLESSSNLKMVNGNAYGQGPTTDVHPDMMTSCIANTYPYMVTSQEAHTISYSSQNITDLVDVNTFTHHSIFDHSYSTATYSYNKIKQVYACALCKRTFSNKESLDEHKLSHMSVRITCKYCNARFSCKSRLKQHLRSHPEAKKPDYACKICAYTTPKKHTFTLHRRRHAIPNHLSCSFCGYIPLKIQELQIHERKHTNEKPYSCLYCDYRATSKSSLNFHTKMNHGIRPHESLKRLQFSSTP